jgi:hypothetical protein
MLAVLVVLVVGLIEIGLKGAFWVGWQGGIEGWDEGAFIAERV